jgi:hypothetical protein
MIKTIITAIALFGSIIFFIIWGLNNAYPQ